MKRSKFNVSSDKEKRTYNGIVFDSQREAQRYCELKLLEKKGEISQLRL